MGETPNKQEILKLFSKDRQEIEDNLKAMEDKHLANAKKAVSLLVKDNPSYVELVKRMREVELADIWEIEASETFLRPYMERAIKDLYVSNERFPNRKDAEFLEKYSQLTECDKGILDRCIYGLLAKQTIDEVQLLTDIQDIRMLDTIYERLTIIEDLINALSGGTPSGTK